MNNLLNKLKGVDYIKVAQVAGKVCRGIGLTMTVAGGVCDLVTHNEEVNKIFNNLVKMSEKRAA